MQTISLSNTDKQLIELALQEDLGQPWQDVTSQLIFADRNFPCQAKIYSKHPQAIYLCGISLVETIAQKINPNCQLTSHFQDGEIIMPDSTICTFSGNAKQMMMMERTLLNFLRHLCAIATLTAQFVTKIKHTSCQILDTRKTTPGMRHLEKYAVQCGGGINHRMGLYDAIMIKDNHIDAIGGIEKTLQKLPERSQQPYPVVVEVRDINEVTQAIKYGENKIDRLLLDNMDPQSLKQCVQICQGIFTTEASGNIDLHTITAIAETGVDFASIGRLTHSAGNVDLSMLITI